MRLYYLFDAFRDSWKKLGYEDELFRSLVSARKINSASQFWRISIFTIAIIYSDEMLKKIVLLSEIMRRGSFLLSEVSWKNAKLEDR
jgi:hypothetical protein